MKKPILVGVGVLVLLILVRLGVSLASPGDDRTQILEQLNKSLEASREGKSGGVMDLLSNKLMVNNQEASQGFSQVVDYIKTNHPDITVEHPDPIIRGGQAEIDSPVDIKVHILTMEKTVHLKEVMLVFKKEGGLKWGFFPTSIWRLVQVDSPDSVAADLAQ